MKLSDFRKAGHAPTLLSAFLYFDVSFMVWVFLNWWREEHRPSHMDQSDPSGAEAFQYRSSGRAQVRQSDSPFTIVNRPKFTPSPQR